MYMVTYNELGQSTGYQGKVGENLDGGSLSIFVDLTSRFLSCIEKMLGKSHGMSSCKFVSHRET